MAGVLPGLTLEQPRRRVDEEREQHAVRLGGIERALKGASGGVLVAEGVPRDRLLHQGRHQPDRMNSGNGAVDYGPERGRRLRVAMGQPQRR